jgi:hypothetical protein
MFKNDSKSQTSTTQSYLLIHLQQAIQEGARLHAFLSGGGLRIVRLEKDGKLLGYGEHPNIEEALRHADEDAAAGGREYSKVYGKGGYTHYLTGSSISSSDLDRWVLRGRIFDVVYKSDQFVAIMKSIEETEVPKEIEDRVKDALVTEKFTDRGYNYLITPCRFANGYIGISCEILDTILDKGKAWMWDAIRTGRGVTIFEALTNGLVADPEEVFEK